MCPHSLDVLQSKNVLICDVSSHLRLNKFKWSRTTTAHDFRCGQSVGMARLIGRVVYIRMGSVCWDDAVDWAGGVYPDGVS